MVRQLETIQGLLEKTRALGVGVNASDALRAAAAEFILEGLCAHRRISRTEERVFAAEERRRAAAAGEPEQPRKPSRESRRNYQ
jgi:magnesium chelatase subunit I